MNKEGVAGTGEARLHSPLLWRGVGGEVGRILNKEQGIKNNEGIQHRYYQTNNPFQKLPSPLERGRG